MRPEEGFVSKKAACLSSDVIDEIESYMSTHDLFIKAKRENNRAARLESLLDQYFER